MDRCGCRATVGRVLLLLIGQAVVLAAAVAAADAGCGQ